ncbi:hypothetical protein EVJ58_g1786 [Rhodofomes roseus]|uniref:Major facilitator superfamily (MFS) profile domain-containing protein n=1 Tax=Rhodofomes roseus TaxID=34475 RepID=A0A4Y9Z016_9APHY|nr:hypothetical protein EVJ58_g1786 [Rhodofomes roseus]
MTSAAAAMGKVGAAVGIQVFIPIQDNLGKRWTFIVAAIFGAVGILITYVFIPEMTGVDLALQDEKFLKYLVENGWEGQIGDAETKSHHIDPEETEKGCGKDVATVL